MMGLSCRVVVKTGFVESVSKEVGVKAKSPNERDSQDQDRKKERAIFG
jgi:F0F1-type ATP synthase epsilon subunit